MEKLTLFSFEGDDIKISMQLYFTEQGQLYFDGYDIGKKVEDMMGDSDYEYSYTIEPSEFDKFYQIFNLPPDDKQALLLAIKDRFSNNNAYSQLGEFMEEHEIKFKGFTWR
jgi:hypothetical protein